MAQLTVNFNFHNVGQGLFYSGRIGSYNLVYDCGAEKRQHLYAVINNYKNYELRSSKLDLLILSHLHDDHVSGLNVLLNGISVDTVILPYLSPIERLMVALRREDLPLWFYEFLADPVTYLIEKRVEKVVLLGGREPRSPERAGFEGTSDLSEIPDDEALKAEILKHDRQLKGLLDQGKLLVKNHNRSVGVQGIWILRFYNSKVEDSKKNLFEQCIKSAIGTDGLIDVIKNKPALKSLRACYHVLQKNFNDTSLVLYHAPMDGSKYTSKMISNGYETKNFPEKMFTFTSKYTVRLHEANGHFLTGDINLRNVWNEIRIHYGSYVSRISVALLPHHGSKKNWDKTILTRVPHECAWIASSGIANKYGHPNHEVIRDVIRGGSILYWCNELNRVSMQ